MPADWRPKLIALEYLNDENLAVCFEDDPILDGKFETKRAFYDYIVEQLENPQCSYDAFYTELYIYYIGAECVN
jgi:hypothetical protein